jgi:hypothetical protein
MKLPRKWFTVRRMLIAMAPMAVLMLATRAIVSRPYPMSVWSTSTGNLIIWSDDTRTFVDPGDHELVVRECRWGTLINWPDGSLGAYLHLW